MLRGTYYKLEAGYITQIKERGYLLDIKINIMEFNNQIFKKLNSFFIENEFTLTEETNQIIKYQSDKLIISIVYNSRENSNSLWLGSDYLKNFIEIDNELLKIFFDSDLKLENQPKDIFVNKVLLFFKGPGENILKGDEKTIINLEKFKKDQSEKYTSELLDNQNLEAANTAWKEGNYIDVIKYLKKVDKKRISDTFKKKYKIAQKKTSSNTER